MLCGCLGRGLPFISDSQFTNLWQFGLLHGDQQRGRLANLRQNYDLLFLTHIPCSFARMKQKCGGIKAQIKGVFM